MLTIGEAAKLARITRQGIRKAIKDGRLTAGKDEQGRWLVDPADVQRIWPTRPTPEPAAPPRDDVEPRLLRERLAEVVEDRDRWRAQAERLTLLLTDQRQPWWRRWFKNG